MKNKILIILSTFVLFSCDKPCNLPDQTMGGGEIIQNVLIVSKASAQTLSLNTQNQYVIRSEEENNDSLRVSFDNGITIQPIDFTQYSLLANYADGQCRAIFERNVIRDVMNKKIHYSIYINDCGTCKKNVGHRNLVLVPKIPDGYEIVFSVTED